MLLYIQWIFPPTPLSLIQLPLSQLSHLFPLFYMCNTHMFNVVLLPWLLEDEWLANCHTPQHYIYNSEIASLVSGRSTSSMNVCFLSNQLTINLGWNSTGSQQLLHSSNWCMSIQTEGEWGHPLQFVLCVSLILSTDNFPSCQFEHFGH